MRGAKAVTSWKSFQGPESEVAPVFSSTYPAPAREQAPLNPIVHFHWSALICTTPNKACAFIGLGNRRYSRSEL
jgi:hypothetical protein